MNTAVILAAGKGVRMKPFTETMPKCLIPINGRPFLGYLLDAAKAAGITRFVVVVGYLGETVNAFFKGQGIAAEFIEQREQLGTGHALLQAKDALGTMNFLVMGADNLWSPEDIKSMLVDDGFSYVAAIESGHPERYGVLVTDDDYLQQIVEKPVHPPSSLINTGLYKFTPVIFPALENVKPSSRGEIELTDAITSLASLRMVKVKRVASWLDLGRPEDIPLIEGKVG
ncbi:MAG: sugar phosphate nucleotidyltransferase [Nanoarchaeota archaeon]